MSFARAASRLAGTLLFVFSLSLGACGDDGLPAPSSDAYREATSAFYAGLAALQAGALRYAEGSLTRVTELAPGEPAGWANLGLLALREGRLDEAAAWLTHAQDLAPEDARVAHLQGLLAREQGRPEEAVAHLRRAVALAPGDARSTYALAEVLHRLGPDGEAEARSLIDRLLARQPENLFLLVVQTRRAAERGDPEALSAATQRLLATSTSWPEAARGPLRAAEQAAEASDMDAAVRELTALDTRLQQQSAYRASRDAVEAPPGAEGVPLKGFVRLPEPPSEPAPPDTTLRFTAEPMRIDGGPWVQAQMLALTGERVLTPAVANAQTVKLGNGATVPFPGGGQAPPRHGILGADLDNDYAVDLVLAGAGGLRLMQQEAPDAFVDVTDRAGLPAAVRDAAYAGAWAADLDLEGDLDLVLARTDGAPLALRNNGDGTFDPWPLFEDVTGLRDFVWGDLDAGGDPDAVLLDADGRLHLYDNARGGQFESISAPAPASPVRAIDVADTDGNARMELLVLGADGTLLRAARQEGGGWAQDVAARWPGAQGVPAGASLVVADLDNNGALDALAAAPGTGQLWLSDVQGGLRPVESMPEGPVLDVADFTGGGRLDLVTMGTDGQPVRLLNRGDLDYASRSIQVRTARRAGDQRINAFGIGGTVEIRAGLLYQKRRITGPVVHFGLGKRELVDVARVVWPNGSVQAEFDLETDQALLARQSLKGSCPWIFTHDGEGMRFVTDFLWRTALGLNINTQGKTGVLHGVDWVRIDGDALAVRDGFYDVRITAELWETHFFDEVTLMTVDHPAGVEVLVDERFTLPPPTWALHPMATPRPLAGAWDAEGRDVTERVRTRDERYLDTFELGDYQGVARPHYVEVALPEEAPAEGPLWLVASGWIRPTDTSINAAIGQGRQAPPQGLRMEVPDGQGGWTTVRPDLGFPSGKAKTILIDLAGVFRPGTPRRVRLHTSMEIYWDRLAWAAGRPEAEVRTQRLAAETALLRHRGFSVVHQASHSAPELPTYDTLAATTPQWRDLEGYYTRYGDVRPLVAGTDDRYVIMNAGDEMVLKFAAPPPPPDGWVRDFVLVGDGWIKDGDLNTTHSATVRPLPYHGLMDYTAPPTRLEDDPAYRLHPEDWATFHTRYVSPDRFTHALTPAQ